MENKIIVHMTGYGWSNGNVDIDGTSSLLTDRNTKAAVLDQMIEKLIVLRDDLRSCQPIPQVPKQKGWLAWWRS